MSANTNHPLAQAPLDELAAELGRRRAALPKLRSRRDKLMAELATIDVQIEALERLDANAAPSFRSIRTPRSGNDPQARSVRVTMREKILEVLDENPMRPVEIAEAMVDRGLHSGTKSLQVQVSSTLAKFPDFERIARGQWVRASGSGETATTTMNEEDRSTTA